MVFGAKLSVTVFNEKTGEPVKGLTAADFAVTDGNLSLTVESAEPAKDLLDVMLVVDASFISDAIRPGEGGAGRPDELAHAEPGVGEHVAEPRSGPSRCGGAHRATAR
jgi:hypothetical protein